MKRSVIVAGLTLVLVGRAVSGEELFLSSIRVDVESDLDWSKPVYARAWVKDPAALKHALGVDAKILKEDPSLRFKVGATHGLDDPPVQRHREATFMVDFTEPPVVDAIAELNSKYGPKPSIDELVRFVDTFILGKTRTRGWDIASRVARDREGDCTEHAVLLTALARASGYPARVVTGAAIVVAHGRVGGFGHAWGEIHQGTTWQRADAALFGSEADIYYVRSGEITEEGTGFAMGLLFGLDATNIRHIALTQANESAQ